MTDKIRLLLTINQFDGMLKQVVDNIVGELRENFASVYGEPLPKEYEEALGALERAFYGRRQVLEDAFVGVYKRYIDENDLDQLLAWKQNPAAKRIDAVNTDIQNAIGTASDDWRKATFETVEDEFTKILNPFEPSWTVVPPEIQQAKDAAE